MHDFIIYIDIILLLLLLRIYLISIGSLSKNQVDNSHEKSKDAEKSKEAENERKRLAVTSISSRNLV
jgi:hypothetical protein